MSDISGPDQPTKIEADTSGTVFDKEIGDDWGEAFEADEFMQTPEAGESSDFFIDDDEPSSAEASPNSDDPSAVPETASVAPSFPGNLFNLRGFFQKYSLSFLALPLLYRIALPVVLVLVVVILSVYLFLGASASNDLVAGNSLVEQEGSEGNNSTVVDMTGAEDFSKKKAVSPVELSVPALVEPEKVRKSWRLAPFLIPAKDNTKGDDIFFVEANISLVFLLDEGESLPTNQATLVRDIIYQFYTNRPIYELRRYSLARGEMNRKLRAWIEKQWSERHIVTIVFNRYQVL